MTNRILGLFLILLPACASSRPAEVCGLSLERGVVPDLAGAAQQLSELVPLQLPVSVGVAPLRESGRVGLAMNLGDHYQILVDPRLDDVSRHSVLMHEWAHLLVMESGVMIEDPHGPEWGVALSRVFRAWAER